MTDTFFNEGNLNCMYTVSKLTSVPQYDRIVATEYQIEVLGSDEPPRPQPVRGTVHDENAWALNGVSGHAGIFSTVLITPNHADERRVTSRSYVR